MQGDILSRIPFLLLEFVLLLPALVLHEVAHGWVANRLGDPTAKERGRLSLDPLKHIDPVGTVLLPLLLLLISQGRYAFGYAKPVPVDVRRMRVGYQTGWLLTGIAGPAANLLLALAGTVVYWVCAFIPAIPEIVLAMLYFFVEINLVLIFFNLIPIPPFDGSRVFQWFLRGKALDFYNSIERFGFLIIMLLIFVLPQFTGIDPLSYYFSVTVVPVARLLLGG